jgi:ribosomal protein S18 acetylase RimI-like enzyme
VLEMLRHSPAVDRVESQLLLFNAGEFAGLFSGPAFTVYPRLFLECDLHRQATDEPACDVRAELELTPWTAQDYQAAAELIFACYMGHTDSQINDQYRTLHGSLRFLHNIVRFPGCGIFEADRSWMLRDRRTRVLVGMILSSRVAPEVAHITQLCVAPEFRGRGFGRLLLERCAEGLRGAGFEAVSLTVTEGNDQAVRLYERFGFTLRHRFDAMVLNTMYKRR